MNHPLGELRALRTDDGSLSLHSAHFDEAFHSSAGALAEAKAKFVSTEMLATAVRCKEWADLATALRGAFGCEPIRVEGDGACCVSALVVAITNGSAAVAQQRPPLRGYS